MRDVRTVETCMAILSKSSTFLMVKTTGLQVMISCPEYSMVEQVKRAHACMELYTQKGSLVQLLGHRNTHGIVFVNRVNTFHRPLAMSQIVLDHDHFS